ncbi:uncharacterized protein LOC129594108 [Paramacrobiotus metropolitanus]|uniref:uncharacterized protein LOC129594108 n=1 Tax=Paramacrobiotus metropolitanus TaxID=2943436 RepID=UPI002445A6A2|nr:uncharacterized protein LOC129594108 [Paramacrobiotus metropolitanus]XP_055346665.1 uncharacterized protein LOC129594108 [Paramacrobiotus metropolitanus]XP_055346673.1 uncharacterized protein LOC129594108 [Paramacrobiotus metropolitanus]
MYDMAAELLNSTLSSLLADNNSLDANATAASVAAAPVNDGGLSVYYPYTVAQVRKAYYVIYICYPFLLALCTVGNVLTIFVLAHTKHKGSTNTYMMAVAVANLFILWLYMPTYIYNIVKNLPYPWVANFLFHFFQFFGLENWWNDIFVHLSDWTLIIFSLERLLAVTNPFLFQKLKGNVYPRVIVVILFILSATASIYVVYDYYAFYYPNKEWDRTSVPIYKRSSSYMEWNRVQKTSEVSIFIGQFFALLIINSFIAVVVVRISRGVHVGNDKLTVVAKSGDKKRAAQKQRNSVYLLLGSVVLYLITQFPTLIHNILAIADDQFQTYDYKLGARLVAQPCVLMAQYINYAANFLIYMTVSQQFRAQVADVFGQYRCGRWMQTQKKRFFPPKPPVPKPIKSQTTMKTMTLSERLSGLKRAEKHDEGRRGSIDSLESTISDVDMASRPASVLPSRRGTNTVKKRPNDVTAVVLTESARKLETGEASAIQMQTLAPGNFQLKKTMSAPRPDYGHSTAPTSPTTKSPAKLGALLRSFSLTDQTPPAGFIVERPDSRRGSVDSAESDRTNVDMLSQPASASNSRRGTNTMKVSPQTTVIGLAEYVRRLEEQRVSSESTASTVSGAEMEMEENMAYGEMPHKSDIRITLSEDRGENDIRRASIPPDVVVLQDTVNSGDHDPERPPRPDVVRNIENLVTDDKNSLKEVRRLPADSVAIVNENYEPDHVKRPLHQIPSNHKRRDSHVTFNTQAHIKDETLDPEHRVTVVDISHNSANADLNSHVRKENVPPRDSKALNFRPVSSGEMITQL